MSNVGGTMTYPIDYDVYESFAPSSSSGGSVQVIDWHMLDKSKFYPLSLSCSLAVRALLYPMSVIRTRLQIQRQHSVYNSLWHASKSIYRQEGFRGLYKGYWISTMHVCTGVLYVSVYEVIRHQLKATGLIDDHSLRGLVAGGVASGVCQTIAVPLDVLTQHMMIVGHVGKSSSPRVADPFKLVEKLQRNPHSNSFGLGWLVASEVWRRDGPVGFYRGYISSLMLYVPNSAVFWFSYHQLCRSYKDIFAALGRRPKSDIVVQAMAAPSAGFVTTVVTNCLDLYRARIQVQRATYWQTARKLWRDERWGIFVKGLSARLITSTIFSFLSVVGYETVKRYSTHSHINWRW